MTDFDSASDLIERTRKKALNIPSYDGIEGIIMKSINLLASLTKISVDEQINAKTSELLDEELENRQNKNDHPLRDMVYQLVLKIGTTVRWTEEVENMRKISKTEADSSDQDSESESLAALSNEEGNLNVWSAQPGAYDCAVCGKRFPNSYKLLRHKTKHMDENDPMKRLFPCDKCGKRFMNKENLKQHSRTLHLKRQKQLGPFGCDICGKSFTTKHYLKSHMRSHSTNPDVSRPFKCDECGRRFREKGDLRRHEKTHLNGNDPEQALKKKPHQCDQCGLRFTKKIDLNPHKIAKHDAPWERSHTCDSCGKGFKDAKTLKRHKKTHLSFDEKTKYDCENCGQMFLHKQALIKHNLKHIDDSNPEK